jgi:hypothetical protein
VSLFVWFRGPLSGKLGDARDQTYLDVEETYGCMAHVAVDEPVFTRLHMFAEVHLAYRLATLATAAPGFDIDAVVAQVTSKRLPLAGVHAPEVVVGTADVQFITHLGHDTGSGLDLVRSELKAIDGTGRGNLESAGKADAAENVQA